MKFISFFAPRFFPLLIFFGILAILFAVSVVGGYYPVALVNGRWITAATFWHNRDAAFLFEQRRLSLEAGREVELDENHRMVLQTGVLERLIENSLIHDRAEQEIGSDFSLLVQQKIAQYARDSQLADISENLYGLTKEGFIDYVLVPQAEKDLLSGRFLLKDESLPVWLRAEKLSARVLIFSPAYRWSGGRLVML